MVKYQYQLFLVILLTAWSPSGKARVCKTLITGSNPVVAFSQRDAYRRIFYNNDYKVRITGLPAKGTGKTRRRRLI